MYVLNRRAVIGVVERCMLCLVALSTCAVGQGALLKNFAGSYALYQQCTTPAPDFDADNDVDGLDFLMWQRGQGQAGQFITSYGDADRNGFVNQVDYGSWKGQFGGIVPLSDSLCFKLYFDPEGIVSGSVTLVLDVPNPQPGQTRLDLGGMTGLVDLHPGYTATVQMATVLSPPGRQIIEAQVAFQAVNALIPPAGPVTIFGFQADDNQPQLGPGGVQARFEFRAGDFITLFNPDNNQTTTFNNTELATQPLVLAVPLVLDVNTLTGAVSIRNSSSAPVNINYYEITSLAGGLDAIGWTSIDSTEGGDPPGVGWDEAGGASAAALAESNFSGTLPLNTLQSRSLGHAFNEGAGIRDLRFFYSTPQGALIPGVINYNTTSLAGAVPEPGCLGLVFLSFVGVAARRRRA